MLARLVRGAADAPGARRPRAAAASARAPRPGGSRTRRSQALVRELAAQNPGLCVITTRLPVADVAGRGGTPSAVDLEQLPPAAGAELLRRLGVEGPAAELEAASEEFGGHGLALSLLGTYLRDVCDGDVRRRRRGAAPRRGDRAGRPRAAGDGSRTRGGWATGPELQVLRLLGLFDRPAERRGAGGVAGGRRRSRA